MDMPKEPDLKEVKSMYDKLVEEGVNKRMNNEFEKRVSEIRENYERSLKAIVKIYQELYDEKVEKIYAEDVRMWAQERIDSRIQDRSLQPSQK